MCVVTGNAEGATATFTAPRVRLAFSQTAKGFAQMDITSEAADADAAAKALDAAVKGMRAVFAANGLVEAGKEAK